MSRGLDKHRERQERVQSFGRQLARRSRSRCELCEVSGQSLRPWEVPPLPVEPDLESTILVCATCIDIAEAPERVDQDLHFLEVAVWHENTAVKVVAHRILRALAQKGLPRSCQMLGEVFLTPEEADWVDAS